jgi:hypothetical protein
MGVEIKRNEKGLYQLKSGISDESYHPEKKWISEEESKKILITNEIWSFIEKVIEIDNGFPSNYRVNDIHDYKNNTKREHLQWLNDNAYDDEGSKILGDRFEGIIKD